MILRSMIQVAEAPYPLALPAMKVIFVNLGFEIASEDGDQEPHFGLGVRAGVLNLDMDFYGIQ